MECPRDVVYVQASNETSLGWSMATRIKNDDSTVNRKLNLMRRVIQQLIADKVELVEEIKQLQAAVHIYRELLQQGERG